MSVLIFKMKKTILMIIFILVLITVTGCQTKSKGGITANTIAGMAVSDEAINDCLTQIKQANSDVSNKDALDGCWFVEAVNRNDKSLCLQISEDSRETCFAMFK
jgi:hypothetical protein